MQEWEYLSVSGDQNLTKLGQEGWELVAVVPTETELPRFYFKRPARSFRDRVTLEQKQRYFKMADSTLAGSAGAEE